MTATLRMKWRPDAERRLLSEPTVGAFVKRVGNEVADSIRDHAPVATGKLRGEIQDPVLERTPTGWRAFVAFLAWYSLIVEFAPQGQPYIRPGADAALRRHGSRLEGERQ